MVYRFFDLSIAFIGVILFSPLILLIVLLGYFDTGSPLFIQTRVGKNKRPFSLIKFRTMSVGTVSVATHLVNSSSVTRIGKFLRKTKADELPQLFNVLKGDMSLVGPRPNLFNQEILIAERDKRGVYNVLPGITGLAQINNVDMSTPELLAETDQAMLNSFSITNYLKYILLTVFGKGFGDKLNMSGVDKDVEK